ncbi:hypothetical protein BKA67DRAFT_264481 [Truncatella angustata]|uniref:DUF3074 domain-containing protein n=1 Tax=Truncatella angustata TaxID=152316 RepID=A0A9P8ZYD6_9PEZI|nr:uncharacterized protein BKA67DRAFT_264481 [Truncatella angustata]KAH6653916.1 hypothetical protein BKA67DRAFT_264481 [Truncatella angustata]
MSPSHHDVFKALAPIDWDTIDQDDLKGFLTETFQEAQCLIDSIPVSLPTKAKLPDRAPKTSHKAEHLRKEWKDVTLNPKDNPLGVNIYKMSSKDKKGAWFARRSVHDVLSFDHWKLGMQAEFAESLKVQGEAGAGKIRGIGADRKVVDTTVDGCGKMEVYQLSAQFPGPTTPREFVTLLLSTDSAVDSGSQEGLAKSRYYMLVSKPCNHPETPPRSDYIRGQYESVEFIREIKVDRPLRKVRSSLDLGHEEAAAATRQSAPDDLAKEALTRSARSAAMASTTSDSAGTEGRKRGKTISFAEENKGDEDVETLVEWIMVTRSDPGGSVPRFMVERGTPAGIAGDAEKFLKWVQSKRPEDLANAPHTDEKIASEPSPAEPLSARPTPRALSQGTIDPVSKTNSDSTLKPSPEPQHEEYEDPRPGGFYGMIAQALGAVAARLPEGLPNPLGSSVGGDTESDLSASRLIDDDDSSSIQSFHSIDSDLDGDSKISTTDENNIISPVISASGDAEVQSTLSSESAAGKSTAPSHHERELRKLEDKKRRATEKLQRARERALSKKGTDTEKDEAALVKLKEKHDRDIQKQEEKFKRDLKKLDEKRANEQRKAEEKARKQAEKENKQNLSMELEKVKAERDVALKQIDVLKEQIGELQGQNTLLVAKLGKKSSPELIDSIRRADSFKISNAKVQG